MTARSETHAAAIEYARAGWAVFPVQPPTLGDTESGKRPLTPNGKADATTDLTTIDAWWAQHPNANIGCNLERSGLVVFDIDTGKKKDGTRKRGRESLGELDRECGGLEITRSAVTGGGGLHAFYRADREIITSSKIGFRDGLDLIVNGYVVLPPSRHWSGNKYQWSDKREPIALPSQLARAAGAPTRTTQKSPAESIAPGAAIEEGSRNNALFKLGCALRDTGIGAAALKLALDAENRSRFKPPLPDEEIVRVAESVMRRVQPTRDVAAGAVVEEIARELAPPSHATIRASSVIGEIRDKSTLPSVMTPWLNFNEKTGGLEVGSMTLAVGYQGSGKSSQASQLAAFHARGAPVIYYLGEMGARIFVARVVGQALEVSWRDVLRGKVSDADMHRVLDPLDLRIVPKQASAADAIRAIDAELAEIFKARGDAVPLVIVDYVQLLAAGAKDMRLEMIEATRALQTLTETRPIVTWVLSQTSRSNAKRIREGTEDSVEFADTGAETGELERAATIQFTLAYQQKDDTRVHEVTMVVGKRRFGGPTKLYFDYDGETGLFLARSTIIKAAAEQERENAILAELRLHEDGICHGVAGTKCLGAMNANTFLKGYAGVHKIGGNRQAMLATLKRLSHEGLLVKSGQNYKLGRS